MIKSYLEQLRQEGELNNFISEMENSGMKWGVGVYNKNTRKWLQYKDFDAKGIQKLL